MNSFDEDAGHRVPARDEKVTHGNKIGGKSTMPDHATFMLHYADVTNGLEFILKGFIK